MDGKSQEWRDAAHKLLVALAKENKYIVSDMVILFLESADHGLKDYSPLGGVFRRAAKAGIIRKIEQPKATKQSLWISCIYETGGSIAAEPVLIKGGTVSFRQFGGVDSIVFQITNIKDNQLTLEPVL